MRNYVSLHNHTDNSMLDGKGTIPNYVKEAKRQGMGFLGLSDHGVLAGAYEFYVECKKNGIEPVIGEEFYFVPNADSVKDDKDAERFHVVILAKNEKGYQTLVDLSSESHKRFYYKPLIDRNLLSGLDRSDRKNLIVLSGCAAGRLSRMAVGAIPGDADAELQWWRNRFPNFYIELQHHNTSFDRKLNGRLLKLAKKHGTPWVITNDPHYVLKEEACHHDALLAIQTAADIDDPKRFKFDGEGYHLRTFKEMKKAFASYDEKIWRPGLQQTIEIAKGCDTNIAAFESRTWHIPSFPKLPEERTADKHLSILAKRGLKERGLDGNPKYVRRMKHELKQFKDVGMADFLLITADIARFAKRKGIRMGPGRGSVCGTLVGYLIGIHKVNSIKGDLLFERFLNPERPKMPDIDSDFPRSRRDEVFAYSERLYGIHNTMRVGAFQKMQTKSAFGSLARSHGISFRDAQKLSKAIQEDEEGNAVLPDEILEGYPDLIATLESITGIKKGVARHPAGLIIFDPNDDVRNLIPQMYIPSSKKFVAQFDLDSVAGIGLLKQDFLGLRTLDTIDVCLNGKGFIKDRHKIDLEPDDWVPDEEDGDEKIYKMLSEGRTHGVFQMEGGTNHRGIQEIVCTGFEDIVSCTSLYRKGPLDAKADKRYLKNKRDKQVRVLHPTLKPFLSKTWGEMIYQEQMFEILRNLAGFSWARVDDAKTAMTKKDADKMALLKPEAVEGFVRVGGLPQDKAEQLWEQIAAQAGYLFNRSHAYAYSLLTYQTARLKCFYPLEYWAALLATVKPDTKENKEKRERYMAQAVFEGFKMLAPDINDSQSHFTPVGKKGLRFGLTDIKGVGEKACERLLEARPKAGFASLEEVEAAARNKAVMDALRESGALERFGEKTIVARQEERLAWQFQDQMLAFRKKYAKKVKLPDEGAKAGVCIIGEIVKTEKKTTKNGDPFRVWTLRWQPGQEYRINLWSDCEELFSLQKGSVVQVKGKWSPQWSNMAIGDPDDCKILKMAKAS